jgi:hypothetical protein
MNNSRAKLKSIWLSIILAGIVAGVVSTLIQMLLWLIFTDGLPAFLYRDARLTAAVLLGTSVLPPPATFDVGVMLTATLIHFGLSIIFAAVLAWIDAYLQAVPVFLLGIGFGTALYLVNLYGFTVIFPWFAQTRGWITLIAHGAFGLTAIMVYRGLNARAFIRDAQC